MSIATLVAVIFFIFFIFLGVTIWIDGKKTYILAPKYNHENGDSETSGDNAIAEHSASTETGEMLAKTSVNGAGKASASAELGFEYEHSGEAAIELIVGLKFGYQFALETDSDQSHLNAKVESCLNSDSITIASESMPKSDEQSSTTSKGLVQKSQTHEVTLKPGEKFNAYLKLTAEAEGPEGSTSNCQVIAKLEEIYHRPTIKVK